MVFVKRLKVVVAVAFDGMSSLSFRSNSTSEDDGLRNANGNDGSMSDAKNPERVPGTTTDKTGQRSRYAGSMAESPSSFEMPPVRMPGSTEDLHQWRRLKTAGVIWYVRSEDDTSSLFNDSIRDSDINPIEQWQQLGQMTLVKSGPKRWISRLNIGSCEFYIKQFRTPDWRSVARSFLRGGQARWEAERIRLMMERGIPTANLVALGHWRSWFRQGEGFLITESLVGARPLHDALASLRTLTGQRRRWLIETIAKLIAKLHSARLVHNDLHGGNVFVRESGDNWNAWLIDLNKLRTSTSDLTETQVVNDLALLLQTTRRYVEEADLVRFWKCYWQHRSDRSCIEAMSQAGSRRRAAIIFQSKSRHFEDRFLNGLDRRWVAGNHRQIIADRGVLVCRGAAWLGREWVEQQQKNLLTISRGESISESVRSDRVIEIEPASGRMLVDVTALSKSQRIQKRLPPFAARDGWENGYALRRRGLPCAEPILFVVSPECSEMEQLLMKRHAVDWIPLRALCHRPQNPTSSDRSDVCEAGCRVARLLRELHHAGFIQREASIDDFSIIDGEIPDAWTDLSAPNPYFGAMISHPEGLEFQRQLERPQVVQSIASLVTSLATTLQVLGENRNAHTVVRGFSRTDGLRWLKAYLARSDRPKWKSWWREIVQLVTSQKESL